MHGIEFDETHKNNVSKHMIRYSKWTDAVEDITIKTRLQDYNTEHIFLPLEQVK